MRSIVPSSGSHFTTPLARITSSSITITILRLPLRFQRLPGWPPQGPGR